MPETLFCGVDAGTASVRAGLFTARGEMRARSVVPITVHAPARGRAEQSSTEIWAAVGTAIRQALADSAAPAAQVAGLGLDATCSLVLRGRDGGAMALGPSGCDTILWSDHRATDEAARCTATGHAVLDRLGGAMSPEMQVPKLMWLKARRPDLWRYMGAAYDLTDYLGARATGGGARSLCPLAAKWTYLPDAGDFASDFLTAVGLADLRERAGLAAAPKPPGTSIGPLTAPAAAEIGLPAGIPVAAGLIDAFAGALAMIGSVPAADRAGAAALIAGTSTCVMTLTEAPWHGRGFWGPYRDAILPGAWVTEGGQSAAGALLDDVLGGAPDLGHTGLQALVADGLAREGPGYGGEIDVLPDVSGNRTPFADPTLGAVVSGVSRDRTPAGLARLYWRSAVGLALGMRQILGQTGPDVSVLRVTGGHARSPLLMQLLADATGCNLDVAEDVDGVLLGAAMTAAAAARAEPLQDAAAGMAPVVRSYCPDPAMAARLDADYEAFLLMQSHRDALRRLKGS